MNKIFISMLCACFLAGGAINVASAKTVQKNDSVFQVATLQSLAKGNYDGYTTIGQLLKHGDIGLGTFERLNGEMIVVDGVCYQAVVDGSIVKTKAVVSTPFASVKFLHKDYTASLKDVKSIAELKGKLQAIVEKNGVNSTYMGKLEGVFPKIVARSEYAQTPPYKPLAEVLKTDQKEFVFENVEGTVVMVYMPNYMEGVNTPGWHLHFVDKTRTKGGHVFDLALTDGDLILDKADGFYMTMPAGASFQGMDLTDVSKSDIAQVETGKTE